MQVCGQVVLLFLMIVCSREKCNTVLGMILLLCNWAWLTA